MAPIPVERCVVAIELTEPRLSPGGDRIVYGWSAQGVSMLMLQPLDGGPARRLTSHPAPSTGRGMGGGCWCWSHDGRAVIYAANDGNLWLQPVPGGSVRRLTDIGPDRFAAAPHAAPDGSVVAFVVDQAEVWCVELDTGDVVRLDDASADFCFDPFVAADSESVVWQAWNVPDMAWDGARRERADLGDREWCESLWADGALQQPRVLPDGRGIAVRDDTGWLNVWVGDRPLVDEPCEHASASWGLGQRSYCVSPDGERVAFTRNEAGFGRLCIADLDGSGAVQEVARGVHGQLSWEGSRIAALRTGARTPTQVVVYDTASWERTTLAIGPLSGWEREPLVEPELVEVTAADGATLHGRLFRADEPTSRLLCCLHGGPTDQWQVTFMPRLAYWRSRGWNVLVPDHRGSTGHGRAYQQALHGRWGELDVADVVAFLDAAASRGWGDAAHTALMGGSAGGFTALGVIACAPHLVAAVVASYPVTDLLDLTERSHRFERHYTDTLVGPLPASEGRYRDRSPLHFAERCVGTPVLLLHGDADPVVPVEQSQDFAARLRAAGGTVELQVYAGEGHGFRQLANQLDEYVRIGDFFDRWVAGR